MNEDATINPVVAETKPREYLFDNIKAVLILLVVWGHTLTSMRDESDVIKSMYVFVFFFHMPAMVFVSGYFSKNVEKIRNNAFASLFIPYLILNVFSCIYKILVLQEPYEGFRFLRPSWGLWYLLVLFILRFFLKDLIKVRFLLPISFLFAWVCGFSKEFSEYMELSRIACFLPFFLLGYYCNKEHINKIRRIPKIISIAIIVASAALSIYLAGKEFFDTEVLYLRRPYPEDIELEYLILRILIYAISILMGLAVINLTPATKTFLSYIGTCTMTIYILHLYTIPVLEKLEILNQQPYLYLVYTITATILMIYVFTRPIVIKGYEGLMNKLAGLILKIQ